MVKKLSVSEMRQVNFIRKFDDSFIDSWSLDRDFLSLTVIENRVKFRVVTWLSSFVSQWFVKIWSVRIAKHCPPPGSVDGSTICSGYSDAAKIHYLTSKCDVIDFSPVDNLINEMYDTDIR